MKTATESFNQFVLKSEKWLTNEARKAAKGTDIDYQDLLQDALIAAWTTFEAGESAELAASRARWTIQSSARKVRLIFGRETAMDPSDLDVLEPPRHIKTAQVAFEAKVDDALELIWKSASRPVKQAVQHMLEGYSKLESAQKAGISKDQLQDALELIGRKSGYHQQADLSDLPLFAMMAA